ncbi:hypothetical protein [Jatrophihabitans fulvus]
MTGPDPARDARRALAIVQDWAQRNLPAPASGHGGPECQWCPLCQLASALRGENPEIVAGLADSLGALVAAARDLLESASGRATPPPPAPEPRRRPSPSRVHRIVLDDDPPEEGS